MASHSIANRLTWRVVGTMTIVLAAVVALIFAIVWVVVFAILSTLYETAMEVANERINNVFSTVETAVSNNVPEVEENIGNDHKQFFAVEHLLKLNPNIVGAAVALNPGCEPLKGQCSAPYAYRDSTGVKTIHLTSDSYDYLHKEWYTKPVTHVISCWSDPYLDTGGGNIPMVTYSQPLINQQGEVYAVQTADISLDWIADKTAQMDSIFNANYAAVNDGNGNAFTFIISHQGTFVAHPDRTMVMNKNIYDFFKATGREKNYKLGDKLLGTKDASFLIYRDSNSNIFFLFYDKIERTGWTMGTVLPFSDISTPINEVLIVLAAIMLIGMLIVALVCRVAIRRITKPLRQFSESADEIAKGNLSAELPLIKTKDEMLRLRHSFETMQTSLIQQIEETKTMNEEKGRMEGELQVARNIQMSMLPKLFPAFPDRDDVDIYGMLTPAKEVGGDLYDFFIRDEKLFFCIGDVSGKGIPASLVMAVTRSLFRNIAAHTADPGRIAYTLNNAISDGNDSNMFVTFFIGVLDLPTGRLRYCNAGHDAPLLIGDQGVGLLPCDPNLPVGIMPEWKFTQQETVIDPQTTIFLYTDGLTEAEDACHQQFQENRLIDVAKRSERKPQILIENMSKTVHQFVGDAEQSDDLTMMAIQYTKVQESDSRLQRSITLSNNIDEVPQLAAFVDEVCESVGFDMGTTMSMNLAIEEAVVNAMSYAYPSGTKGNIIIEAKANSRRLKFVIIDMGTPFDPTTKAEVDTSLSAEERPIGGLGIHLVRQIMDSINYERTNGMNVLTLRKKLP